MSHILTSYAKRRGFSTVSPDNEENLHKPSTSSFGNTATSSTKNSPNLLFLLTKYDISAELRLYTNFLKTLPPDQFQQLSMLNRCIIGEILNSELGFQQNRPHLVFHEFYRLIYGCDYDVSSARGPEIKNSAVCINDEFLYNSLSDFVRSNDVYFLNVIFEKFIQIRILSTASSANILNSDKNNDQEVEEIDINDGGIVSGEKIAESSTRVGNLTETEEETKIIDKFVVIDLRRIDSFDGALEQQPSDYPNLHKLFNENPSTNATSDDKDVLFCYSLNFKNDISSIDISIDRSRLVCGTNSGRLYTWSLTNSSNSRENCATFLYCTHNSCTVNCVKLLSLNNEYPVLSGSEDGSIRLWRKNSNFYSYVSNSYPVISLDVDEENGYFLSASYNSTVGLYDFENLDPLRILAGHTESVQSATFLNFSSPNGRHMIGTTSMDRTVKIWSMQHALPVKVFHLPPGGCCYPTVLKSIPPSGILCGTADRKVLAYDLRKDDGPMQILDLQDTIPYTMDVDFSSLYVAGSNGILKIFDRHSTSNTTFEENPSKTFCINGGGGVDSSIISCLEIPTKQYPYVSCVVTTDNGS